MTSLYVFAVVDPAGVTYLTSPTDYEAHLALIRFVPIQHRAKRQAAKDRKSTV